MHEHPLCECVAMPTLGEVCDWIASTGRQIETFMPRLPCKAITYLNTTNYQLLLYDDPSLDLDNIGVYKYYLTRDHHEMIDRDEAMKEEIFLSDYSLPIYFAIIGKECLTPEAIMALVRLQTQKLEWLCKSGYRRSRLRLIARDLKEVIDEIPKIYLAPLTNRMNSI